MIGVIAVGIVVLVVVVVVVLIALQMKKTKHQVDHAVKMATRGTSHAKAIEMTRQQPPAPVPEQPAQE